VVIRPYRPALGPRQSALRGKEHFTSPVPDALANEALVGPILVYGGGIQVIDAEIQGPVQRGCGLLVIPFPIPAHHAHAAEAKSGDGFAGAAELSVFHPPDDTCAKKVPDLSFVSC
jgi:hypothetical protein